jgi:hypothetical protein
MSVGHKSTKEKFMKKNLIIMLIVLFTFSITFIACDNDPDKTDPTLNGTWSDKDGNTINFNNGTIIIIKGVSSQTGTFTTDGNRLTYMTQVTEYDFFGSGHPLSKDEVLYILENGPQDGNLAAKIAQANEIFDPKTVTLIYFIDRNKLYLIYEDQEGNVTDIQTFAHNK